MTNKNSRKRPQKKQEEAKTRHEASKRTILKDGNSTGERAVVKKEKGYHLAFFTLRRNMNSTDHTKIGGTEGDQGNQGERG